MSGGGSEREAAERLLASGQLHQAVRRFREILARSPDDPVVRGRLAETYRRLGNVERAFHHFEQAARTLVAFGQDALAADHLVEADALVPGEPEVLFRLARCLERLGRNRELAEVCLRLERAARAPGDRRRGWALERLVAVDPENPSMARHLARFHLEAGQPEPAATAYRAALAAALETGQGLEELLDEVGREARARPVLRLPLAEHALAQGDPRSALSWLVPLHELEPDSVPVLMLVERCLEALDAQSKLRATRMELVKVLVRSARPREALAAVGRLLEALPEDDEVLELCADAFSSLDRPLDAGRSWLRLAERHQSSGATADRDRAIVQLLRAAPNEVEVLSGVARLLATTGRSAEARSLEHRIAVLEGRSLTPSQGETPTTRRGVAPGQAGATAPGSDAAPVYGRGLSLASPAMEVSVTDTLDDLLGEAGLETEDVAEREDVTIEEPVAPEVAAAAVETELDRLGDGLSAVSPGPAEFERRHPSTTRLVSDLWNEADTAETRPPEHASED